MRHFLIKNENNPGFKLVSLDTDSISTEFLKTGFKELTDVQASYILPLLKSVFEPYEVIPL